MSASLTVSPVQLKDAASGMAQQMVFWGHDVRHPRGNTLTKFGMARSPSPGLTGTSCYSMLWEHGSIELHGAVASWTPADGGTGCIFSRDWGRIELWKEGRAPVPGKDHGVSGSPAERWEAALPIFRWLVTYEIWVATTLGGEWRAGTWRALKRLPKGKPWISPELALRWWELAADGIPPRPKNLVS